jgi:hypothetical protein
LDRLAALAIRLRTGCSGNSPDGLRAVPRRPAASGTVWPWDGLGHGGTACNSRIGLLFGLRRKLWTRPGVERLELQTRVIGVLRTHPTQRRLVPCLSGKFSEGAMVNPVVDLLPELIGGASRGRFRLRRAPGHLRSPTQPPRTGSSARDMIIDAPKLDATPRLRMIRHQRWYPAQTVESYPVYDE